MTEGSIVKQVILFSLPLMLGNAFQMLYNTVDSIVVGNFVGTQALAAVGSTTMIVNMLIHFFNGFSVGAGVVISHLFGARQMERLHVAIETAMLGTFLLSILLSVVGVLAVKPLLRLMATPADVFEEATVYLQIYIAGISGLLIYNMTSSILRAVGDSTRPLYFLILTSVLNILLDLFFVLVLHRGIAGVAYATIIAQFVSATLTLLLLTRTKDVYRLTWKDMRIDWQILRQVVGLGIPTGVQSILTSVSNVFVQSYINAFGSGCMAGWSSYSKLDQFCMLPMQSLTIATTTFVGQNIGAKQNKRADRGTVSIMLMAVCVETVLSAVLFVCAPAAIRLFSKDAAVLSFGVLFLRTNIFFQPVNAVAQTYSGSLRGRGDTRGPTAILLLSFVALRQIYLYLITRFVANTPVSVCIGFPVGWVTCCAAMLLYYYTRGKRKSFSAA